MRLYDGETVWVGRTRSRRGDSSPGPGTEGRPKPFFPDLHTPRHHSRITGDETWSVRSLTGSAAVHGPSSPGSGGPTGQTGPRTVGRPVTVDLAGPTRSLTVVETEGPRPTRLDGDRVVGVPRRRRGVGPCVGEPPPVVTAPTVVTQRRSGSTRTGRSPGRFEVHPSPQGRGMSLPL